MTKLSEKKKKYAYWMYPSMVDDIEKTLDEADAQSKSEFVCRAVEFYMGYLRSQKNVNYIAPVIASVLKSEIQGFERNLLELIFKLSVEIAMQNNLTAVQIGVDDDTLERLRNKCSNVVANNNGIFTLEEANRYQHGEE